MTDEAIAEVSMPSAETSTPAPEAPATSKDGMAERLRGLAKKEDATDYIAETRDQQDYKDGDPAFNSPERARARLERHREAMRLATEEASKATGEIEGNAPETIDPEVQASEHQETLRRERVKGQAEVRFENFRQQNPERAEAAKAVYAVISTAQHLDDRVMASPDGPELAARLAEVPEAIDQLNKMSPHEVDVVLAKVEGAIEAERRLGPRGQVLQPKRMTSAPPPMKKLSGGASPLKDLNALAKKEDATEYINEVRRRERAKAQLDGRR